MFAGRSSEPIEHYITTRLNFIMGVAILAAILCILVDSLVIKKRITSPIKKIGVVAQRMTEEILTRIFSGSAMMSWVI